jgi:hypothetical protein
MHVLPHLRLSQVRDRNEVAKRSRSRSDFMVLPAWLRPKAQRLPVWMDKAIVTEACFCRVDSANWQLRLAA